MTEVSNFQTIKTNFTFSRSVISSFAVRAYLVLGPGCIIVASLSRIRIKKHVAWFGMVIVVGFVHLGC